MTAQTIPFDNQYISLADEFYSDQKPTPVPSPCYITANDQLATELGIDINWLHSDQALAVFSGNDIAAGSRPVATAYAGHQFGQFNPQLGDGRAVLLGDVVTSGGDHAEIQLKGAGQTVFSRGGDGRSPLGPVLREYIMTEAMHALGVPTTRSLYAATTGERVFRKTAEPGAILCRVASSHIRVGTFQFFAARQMHSHVKALADYVIKRHYPSCKNSATPYQTLFESIAERQAKLIAKWHSLGFIHGVMNTDNMLVCGETVDYGPCAFIDTYKPDAVFSSIDTGGRYALDQQAYIGQWNLVRLAECLLGLFSDDQDQAIEFAQQALSQFVQTYTEAYQNLMAEKLALPRSEQNDALAAQFLALLAKHQLDYHLAFRQLSQHRDASLLVFPSAFDSWFSQWQLNADKTKLAALDTINPLYIPRLHLIESAIQQAYNENSFTKFHELLEVCTKPFTEDPTKNTLKLPPESNNRVFQTFCGT